MLFEVITGGNLDDFDEDDDDENGDDWKEDDRLRTSSSSSSSFHSLDKLVVVDTLPMAIVGNMGAAVVERLVFLCT